MQSESIRALIKEFGNASQKWTMYLLGSLAALAVPLLAWLCGAILDRLIVAEEKYAANGSSRSIGRWLPDITAILPSDLAPMAEISLLLFAVLLTILITAILLYAFYRAVQHLAIDLEIAMIERLREKTREVSTLRTLSAQQIWLGDCLNYHIPRIRLVFVKWWKTYPRHLVQMIASILLILLIQPTLTLLTLVAAALVISMYWFIDHARGRKLPVMRERASQERAAIVQLTATGPLLETVHSAHEVEGWFNDVLDRYRLDATQALSNAVWKTPLLISSLGTLICLFVFTLCVRILQADSNFTVAGAFAFMLCVVGVAISGTRLVRAYRDLRNVGSAIEELTRYLNLPSPSPSVIRGQALVTTKPPIRWELDHVSLADTRGRSLLEDLSVVIPAGRFIGIIGSQPLPVRAFVELLIGFGRPDSGRLLINGQLANSQVCSEVLQQTHYVSSDGALTTATVKENLCKSHKPIDDGLLARTIEQFGLKDTLARLPDGIMTLVTPGDDRLLPEDMFRFALARAALSDASIIVIEEPGGHHEFDVELRTLQAIRALVAPHRAVLVIAQRLQTLRQADQLLLLHEGNLVDVGTHAELLQRCEIYRHINYLRFNPFRNAPPIQL